MERRVTLDALPPVARAIAAAVADGVTAAGAADAGAFDDAARRLSLADPEHVRLVLGGVVRPLLEELLPDGVDADGAREVAGDAVRAAVPWWPAVDAGALIVVLAGALGIHEDAAPATDEDGDDGSPREEPAPRPSADAITRHALLLVATLLASRGRPLRPYLEQSFTELARAETVEQP
jgi:hypothetical protein